jgi:hypothetical protein
MGENSCEPVIKAAQNGLTVNYKNKTLLSSFDPIAQAERVVKGLQMRDRTLYFCPSPLFGYGLKALLSQIPSDCAILCTETDEKLFSLSLSSIDKALLKDKRIAIVNEKNADSICIFIRENWGPRAFRRIETVKLSGGWQLDSTAYASMEEEIRNAFALDWGNAMTISRLGRRFMQNVIRNIGNLDGTMPFTSLSFDGKPVLVLGAGPSLDPLLDKLGEAGVFCQRGKYVLVCVDTCLSILRERGIIPDFTVILESQYWNLRDFYGSRDTGIPAIADLSAYPPSVNILGGPVYYFCTPWTKLRFLDRLKKSGIVSAFLPPLGSVGLSAVELSMQLSSAKIIAAGIDFSFTLDKLHARSSPAHLAFNAARNRFSGSFNADAVFCPGVFDTVSKINTPVKSNPAMRNYRSLFEREFSGNRIFDIEGSGLPLGINTIKIEDAVNILTKENSACCEKETNGIQDDLKGKILNFIKNELALLEDLKNILTGTKPCRQAALEKLLDDADYVWAHFPDCAGGEGKRPGADDVGFLKRVSVETGSFGQLWGLVLNNLMGN